MVRDHRGAVPASIRRATLSNFSKTSLDRRDPSSGRNLMSREDVPVTFRADPSIAAGCSGLAAWVLGLNLGSLSAPGCAGPAASHRPPAARPLVHPDLLLRRPEPSRHLGHEAEGPARGPRASSGRSRRACPGIQVGEHLPHSARVVDRLAIIRSVHHPMTNHNAAAFAALCGRSPRRAISSCWATTATTRPALGRS